MRFDSWAAENIASHDESRHESRTGKEGRPACGEWQPLLMLSAAGGELEPAEQARLTAHLADCAGMHRALAREKELSRCWRRIAANPTRRCSRVAVRAWTTRSTARKSAVGSAAFSACGFP